MAEWLDKDRYQEWDDFTTVAKGGTIFHTSWYLSALHHDVRILVQRDRQGQIEAGVAITPTGFLGTRAERRPYWAAYNGPLVRASTKPQPIERASSEKSLLCQLLEHLPKLGLIDFLLPPEYVDVMPYLWEGYESSILYTYQLPPAPTDEWQARMGKNHRRDLKRAAKDFIALGVQIEVDPPFDEFLVVLKSTVSRRGFHFPPDTRHLRGWWEAVRAHDAGTAYLLRTSDGHPVTAALTVRDHRCSYYIAGGTTDAGLQGNLKYLPRIVTARMLQDAHNRNLTFDFEGSILPTVEPFFRGWGGQLVPKYRVMKIRTPWSYAAWTVHQYLRCHRKTRKPAVLETADE